MVEVALFLLGERTPERVEQLRQAADDLQVVAANAEIVEALLNGTTPAYDATEFVFDLAAHAISLNDDYPSEALQTIEVYTAKTRRRHGRPASN